MNSKKIWAGIFAGAALTVLSACLLPVGDGEGLDPSGEPQVPVITLQKVYSDVFQAKCAFCHGGTTPSGGLNLSSPSNALNAFFEADSVTPKPTADQPTVAPTVYVLPGSPEGSFLYQKITSTSPKYGGKMPASGSLTQVQIDLIRDWILGGALIIDTTGATP